MIISLVLLDWKVFLIILYFQLDKARVIYLLLTQ